MVIAIAGGHGQIARQLSTLLSARDDRVRALIRDPRHEKDVRDNGAEPLLCDLESATQEALAAALDGADAVVFAAGAGPGSGAERKLTVDYGGAAKLIAAARAARVGRYVMISAMGAASPPEGDEVFAVYLQAKARADRELAESGLEHTIVRPGRLTDEPATGRVRAADTVPRGDISRADVAALLAAVLHDPRAAGLTFEVVAGEDPIERALAALTGG
jgi:uncharacterized protein YbjT (DUF2867 family)